ncbi:hypothetical protein BROUX41_003844 [Berkeleyomyces rouxiae]
MRAAAHARSLANVIRGVPANLLRLAACAAIFPVLLYGASVWYHGPQRYLATGRLGSARQIQLVDMVSKAIVRTAKAIVPAYRTTPHEALFREAGVLPARIMLDRCRRAAAVRIAGLDDRHPLARLARARTHTRLTLRHNELPRAPAATRILPLCYPPPKPPETKSDRQTRATKARIARIPYCDLQVFLDDSKLQDGSTGAAATMYIAGLDLPPVATHLGNMMEVYDAKLFGALAGLKAAFESPASAFAENVVIMLANQEAAYRLLVGHPTPSSQDIILDFRATAAKWPARSRNPMSPGSGRVIVQWISGHADIPGNEAADRAAKTATSSPSPEGPTPVSLAALASWARAEHVRDIVAYWQNHIPGTYLELQIPWYTKAPPELSLPRFYLSFILQCRTAHGDFELYHVKLGHPPESWNCSCGMPKARTHFLFCKPARQQTKTAAPRLRLGSIQSLLGSPEGTTRFAQCLAHSEFPTRYSVPVHYHPTSPLPVSSPVERPQTRNP